MGISTRSILLAGVTVLTASTVAVAQSVEPAPPRTPAASVELTASVRPLPDHPRVTALPETPTALTVPIAPNLADAIDSLYVDVEEWVQYGFELATAAVSWIPYVGWFSGQIMVLYDFGESIVASGVFNFTDWLRGDGGIISNVIDFGVDVALAFVWLGLDEVAQFIPLPPCNCYPPRPPVAQPVLAAATLEAPPEATTLTVDGPAEEPLEPQEATKSVEPVVDEVAEEEVATEEEVADEAPTDEAPTDEEVIDDVVDEDLPEDTDETTTDTSGTVRAQGEVRGGGSDAVTEAVTNKDDTTTNPSADPSDNKGDPSAPADDAPAGDSDSGSDSGSDAGASPE